MKNTSNQPQKQDYRLFDSFEIKKEGVNAPTEGTGALKGRLLRLMEQELKEKWPFFSCSLRHNIFSAYEGFPLLERSVTCRETKQRNTHCFTDV